MMMTTKMCTLAAIFVLCTLIPSSQAHTFFAANLTDTLGDASLNGYTHSGVFFYNLTSTTLTNKTITSAKLVIGNPADEEANPITVVTLQGPVFPNSTATVPAEEGELETPDPSAYGRFSAEDLSPAAVEEFSTNEGGIYDAMQVACTGDLYVVLETTNDSNSIYAPLTFVPSRSAPERTCEESVLPYKAAVVAPAPTSGANLIKSNGLLLAIILFLLV